MKAIIQRVSNACVTITDLPTQSIGIGYVVLLGIAPNDTQANADYIAHKIANLRLFNDANGKLNLNINQVQGSVLLVSQFTLFANTKKGNRPSFVQAANPSIAEPLYLYTIKALQAFNIIVKHGVFGANMDVQLTNQGPVTIVIDTNE